jgi:hypothetical protein
VSRTADASVAGPSVTVVIDASAKRWQRLAYVAAAIVALVIASFVARIPVQVSDSLGNMLQVQQQTYGELFLAQLYNNGYLRPLLWLQIKAAFDVAAGHYWLTFKIIHALQLLAAAILFVRLLRVRDARGCVAACVALAMLFGLHTFNGTVREAFPINSFLTVIVAVLAVMNLTIDAPSLWKDALALVVLALTTFTVESGLLVFVALAAALVAGLRGVSFRGVAASALFVGVYFYLRFGPLATGSPGLFERASGFGFRMLEPHDLVARFGDNPLPFYLYNVGASLIGTMLAEPRSGVWYATNTLWNGGSLPAWLTLNILSGAVASGVALWFAGVAFGRWRGGRAGHRERLALVAAAVFGANAVLSFPYAKDVIMSVGGACLALLTGLAIGELLDRRAVASQPARRTVGLALVGAIAVLWAVRVVALPHLLAEQAFRTRSEWAGVYEWLENQRIELKSDEARALVEALRRDALATPLSDPSLTRPAYAALFDLN